MKNKCTRLINMEIYTKVGLRLKITKAKMGKTNSFIALRSETLNEAEEEGVDKFFKMMIAIRQQIMLRRKFENEPITNS